MNARSALFDLYGDHLSDLGGAAPVSALVRMLATLGVTAPAVRTAISRMVRQRWLRPVATEQGPGYAATAQASRRLAEAATRIYRRGIAPWDGSWHLVLVDPAPDRPTRARVRAGLGYLGYASLGDGTWIGPRESDQIDDVLAGLPSRRFRAAFEDDDGVLASRVWDLGALAAAYRQWVGEAQSLVGDCNGSGSSAEAFRVRSKLVHEWRKFLFSDPNLPRELLPREWPGDRAAAFFDAEAARLMPAARSYVEACLHGNGDA
ncbi:MAG TPA: PaaX family transcriptional regulator C-terminal domain-containing protein [Nocardioidaceae bacterium]|nr:PaaX family transcriptional regulator C-terminal domain-containing protein [Nocardioidaceae bacterium]